MLIFISTAKTDRFALVTQVSNTAEVSEARDDAYTIPHVVMVIAPSNFGHMRTNKWP